MQEETKRPLMTWPLSLFLFDTIDTSKVYLFAGIVKINESSDTSRANRILSNSPNIFYHKTWFVSRFNKEIRSKVMSDQSQRFMLTVITGFGRSLLQRITIATEAHKNGRVVMKATIFKYVDIASPDANPLPIIWITIENACQRFSVDCIRTKMVVGYVHTNKRLPHE